MTKYQIECNYRLALKRADELSETARNIMKVSENISNDVMAGLEADWHGNSATDYKRKLNLFSAKVECEAKKLENIANTIRRVAKRTYDTLSLIHISEPPRP